MWWRYLVGMAAGVLLMAGGVFWWRTTTIAGHAFAEAPSVSGSASATGDDAMPDPPAASEKTREQKRLSRIDHDKDGQVSRDEFLAARRRNFAKLDKDGDGKLSFDEYAAKAIERFDEADKDKSGKLNAAEFATTKAVRKAHENRCPPQAKAKDEDES